MAESPDVRPARSSGRAQPNFERSKARESSEFQSLHARRARLRPATSQVGVLVFDALKGSRIRRHVKHLVHLEEKRFAFSLKHRRLRSSGGHKTSIFGVRVRGKEAMSPKDAKEAQPVKTVSREIL